MKQVAIVLLNYNSANDTLECVDSIINNCSLDYEIIVVDNNSTDNSKVILEQNKNNYTLILNDENAGFAKGNNIGIEYALEKQIPYVLLLNNDTLIEKNSIEKLYSFLIENSQVGVVAPRIMYYPDTKRIWFDGGRIDWNKCTVEHINMGKNDGDKNLADKEAVSEVDFLTGCCILIRAEVLNKVGLLPTEYFMYYEDVDFSVKIKEAGYKLFMLRTSKIFHKVSSSSGGEDSPFSIKWCTRNRLIFIEKYKKSMFEKVYTYSFFYSTRILKLIKYLAQNDKDRYNALMTGIKEGRKYNKDKE